MFAQKSLNKYQRFALRYAVAMMRRIEIEDIEDTLQRQTYYLSPDRYYELFLAGEFSPEPLSGDSRLEEEEVVVNDVDELDAYFNALESGRTMSGSELFANLPDDEGGWT